MEFTGIYLITEDVPGLSRFYEAVLRTTAVGRETQAEVCSDGTATGRRLLCGLRRHRNGIWFII